MKVVSETTAPAPGLDARTGAGRPYRIPVAHGRLQTRRPATGNKKGRREGTNAGRVHKEVSLMQNSKLSLHYIILDFLSIKSTEVVFNSISDFHTQINIFANKSYSMIYFLFVLFKLIDNGLISCGQTDPTTYTSDTHCFPFSVTVTPDGFIALGGLSGIH